MKKKTAIRPAPRLPECEAVWLYEWFRARAIGLTLGNRAWDVQDSHFVYVLYTINSARRGESVPLGIPQGLWLARWLETCRTLWPWPSSRIEIEKHDLRLFQSDAETLAAERRFCELAAHMNKCEAIGSPIEMPTLPAHYSALVSALRRRVS